MEKLITRITAYSLLFEAVCYEIYAGFFFASTVDM